MPNSQHLPLYLKIYQLIKFLYERVRNFPKEHKYTLGENILNLNWQCLDLVLEANVLPNEKKCPKVLELSITFDNRIFCKTGLYFGSPKSSRSAKKQIT